MLLNVSYFYFYYFYFIFLVSCDNGHNIVLYIYYTIYCCPFINAKYSLLLFYVTQYLLLIHYQCKIFIIIIINIYTILLCCWWSNCIRFLCLSMQNIHYYYLYNSIQVITYVYCIIIRDLL